MRKVKTGMPVALTIGHSTRTWKDFLDLLRAHRVKRVIDVRSIPRSRHNPQFNRETFSKKLRGTKIGYVYLRKLGGLRRPHRDSVNMGWRDSSFRGFADYMQTSEFGAGLDRLMKLAAQKRSAIMCAKAVSWRCRRSLIADALTVRGIRVDNIMSFTLETWGRRSCPAAAPGRDKFSDKLPEWLWPKVRVLYYIFSAGFLVLTAAALVVMISRRAV